MKKLMICSIAAVALFTVVVCGGGGGGDDRTVKLYGATNGERAGLSVLVLLSPEDGTFINTVGPVGYKVTGLEYDAVSGKLFGSTSSNDQVLANGLIEIDMSTGVATTIGPSGMGISRLTVNSTGEMYAWSPRFSEDGLISVDTTTGVASTVGSPSGIRTLEHGLAFDNEDTLYMINGEPSSNTIGAIYTLDTANGAATYFTLIGSRAHHGDFHPVTGMYWGIDEKADDSNNMSLLIIDVNTAAILDSIPTVDGLHAVTFFYE